MPVMTRHLFLLQPPLTFLLRETGWPVRPYQDGGGSKPAPFMTMVETHPVKASKKNCAGVVMPPSSSARGWSLRLQRAWPVDVR